MNFDLWYVQYIEEGVREAVKRLRNRGINTECSCHHDMEIQFQVLDPTTELREIFNAFAEDGFCPLFEVEIKAEYSPDMGYFKIGLIRLTSFEGQKREKGEKSDE